MKFERLYLVHARTNPDGLFRLLTFVALLSICVIVTAGGYGFQRVFSGFVIKSAQQDSVQLCRALLEDQKGLVFAPLPGQGVELRLQTSDILSFDSRLRHYLAPFNIIKVKMYNTRKEIIYSTEPMLIGKVDQHNRALARALGGAVDTKLVTKDTASDLADEPLRNVDVVETYVPVMSPDKRPVGCFEIYMNVTHYRDHILRGVVSATSLLAVILIAVFGVSFLVVRGGTDQLKEAQKKLELSAITDPLTGIANRGYLMRRGEEEFERIRRLPDGSGATFGCIMLDLDHFKLVNDTRGHHAGDDVLIGVAGRLKASLRPYDVIGRYGGEEFVVLLPDTNFEQSLMIANRLLERMRSEPFVTAGQQLPISASLGVTVSNAVDGCLSDVITRADEGMYKAKADGRNRVAWIYHPYDAELHS